MYYLGRTLLALGEGEAAQRELDIASKLEQEEKLRHRVVITPARPDNQLP